MHGWTCDRSLWAPQVNAFSAKYRVIAIDLPGHGESDKPEDITYDSKLFAKAVVAVMDDARAGQAVLVGHSMGLPVIREVYAEAPGRVRALVSVDGSVLKGSLAEFAKQLQGEQGLENRRKFLDSFFDKSTPSAVRERVSEIMLRAPERVAVSAMSNAVGYDWDNAAPLTAVPVLSVSRKRPNTNYESLFREAFPHADYREMDGVGHFLHLDKPDEFNAIVLEFVRNLPKAGAADEMSPDAERFMSRALELAVANAASGHGGPFGAVVVRDDRNHCRGGQSRHFDE